MDIAIAGSGVAGSSLYRMLTQSGKDRDIQVDLYGRREPHLCGIHPCGWITHIPDFRHMMDRMGLPTERYVLQAFSRMNFDGFPIPCTLATIDKPGLLQDLRGPAVVREEPVEVDAYDVVVDCTGTSRVLLPPAKDDLVTPTIQFRVQRSGLASDHLIPAIRFVKIGYAWSFPLDPTHLHIGIGSLVEDLPETLKQTGLLRDEDAVLCGCRSRVRVGAPHRMIPLHYRNIWGVGESIGTVSPLVGDGIVPSMQCAFLFENHLRKGTLDQYQEQVLSRFSWMEEERRVIDRMIAREGKIAVKDLMLMRNHAHRFGLHLRMDWILSWMFRRRDRGIDG